MSDLKNIERLAQQLEIRRSLLARFLGQLDEEVRAARRRHLSSIRKAVAAAKEAQLELHQAIDANRGLFEKPRTRIFHGTKLGLQKGKGKVSWNDPDKVVELIERHLADQAELLIATEKKPVKAALLGLDAKDLKRIGCTITGTGDEVLIKPVDSDIDKLVEALLSDSTEDEEARA